MTQSSAKPTRNLARIDPARVPRVARSLPPRPKACTCLLEHGVTALLLALVALSACAAQVKTMPETLRLDDEVAPLRYRDIGRSLAISGDGHHVAYAGQGGIALVDRESQRMEWLALPDSSPGNVSGLSISQDGRFLAFVAKGIPPAVYLYDRQRQDLSPIDLSPDGRALISGVYIFWTSMSADGALAAFSAALPAEETPVGSDPTMPQLYLHDRLAGTTEHYRWPEAPFAACCPEVSGDGHYVGFLGSTKTGDDSYLFDRQANQLQRLDFPEWSEGPVLLSRQAEVIARPLYHATDGGFIVKNAANQDFTLCGGSELGLAKGEGSISADGARLVFAAPPAVPEAAPTQIWGCDTRTGALHLLSAGVDGAPGNGPSYEPALSDDGRWLVFLSAATNLGETAQDGREWGVYVRELAW